jgi:hypothetical protein
MRTILALILFIGLTSCATDPKDKPEDYFKIAHKERECVGPYGQVKHGKKLTMYKELIVQGESKCKSEIRVCTDGALTGSFIFPGCTEVAKASK